MVTHLFIYHAVLCLMTVVGMSVGICLCAISLLYQRVFKLYMPATPGLLHSIPLATQLQYSLVGMYYNSSVPSSSLVSPSYHFSGE